MSGLNQNTKYLTINQLQRLIANNGVLQGSSYTKALNAGLPVEYCLDALNASLNAKLQAKSEKLDSSAMREFIASYAPHAESISNTVFPPVMPVKRDKINYVEKFVETVDKRNNLKKPIMFNFGAPLWQVERLTLDERINYMGAV